MANFTKIIDYLFSSLTIDRGTIFESYCKWFLENDPRYSLQIKKVLLWNDWPGNWGRDKGIDLIAETYQGEIWAIQAKAYDENYYITKEDVDKFLSESSRKIISFRLLISTTSNMGPNAREVLSAQEKQVGLCLSENLKSSELDWSLLLKNNEKKVKQNPKIPYKHQEEAINASLAGFEKNSHGQLYMACGTGKTLVGLWIAERLQSQNTLVLVPSISLVAQLFREWSANCGNFVFDPIFICHDKTVGKNKDDEDHIVMTSAELGFPVTTDSQELVKQFSMSAQKKVIFSTYHSSSVIADACSLDSSINFDLVIADEAHRCAGPANSDFATVVDKEAIRTKYKLFMTATPKFFSEQVKQKTQENAYEIVSMDDEEKFGPVFHKLLFSDAIRQNLLSDYQVLISIMDNATYREYVEKGRFVSFEGYETDARTLATQLLAAKAIKEHNLKKVISFHNRKKAAQKFVNTFSKALLLFQDKERPHITFQETIFGEMSQSERKKILKGFEALSEESIGLLANVKCLSEGVDVPALDGIIFVDPKGSEIDIIQAVGRAIRKSPNKKLGTIIIPIFVDLISDEIQYLEQSCFKVIWKIVRALRMHDNSLAEEIDYIRLELGKRTYKTAPKLGKIMVDVPINIDINFSKALKFKIVENCSKISLSQSHPKIAQQWHPSKNGSLRPSDITAGSNKKVWWLCSKNKNHEWQSTCSDRTGKHKSKCPFCSGRQVHYSNCLAIVNPVVAKEWHPIKNNNLTPYEVTVGSAKKIWWLCSRNKDHEWKASCNNRTTQGQGCPFCVNKRVSYETSLVFKHPEIAKEWHSTKNGNLTPNDVTAGSDKKIWWSCAKNKSHEWIAACKDRTKKKSKCPFCTNKKATSATSLATMHPNLTIEWHYEKNFPLIPQDVVPGNTRKIWWQCNKNKNHIWQAKCNARTRKGSGCPCCSGHKVSYETSLAFKHPEIAEQWHPSKNGNLRPSDITAGSNKKIWWLCSKNKNHEWQTTVCDRKRGRGCTHCYRSKKNLAV